MKAVTAAIIQSGDSFLIARRAPGEKFAGFWEFPGGKVVLRLSFRLSMGYT